MIAFFDLKAQHSLLRGELYEAIDRVLTDGQFVLGSVVEEFETRFAQRIQSRFAVGVSNGLDAIRLALLAAGVGHDDEVIVPANTYIATALAVASVGARVVLVDADELSYNIDVRKVECTITNRTKAVIPVHLYGQAADMLELLETTKTKGIAVIEDSCQSHDALYRDRYCGAIGDIGCFSFFPSKNLGACGDGGLVVTNDPQIAKRVRMLRDYGQARKYEHLLKGLNARLDSLQAAILLAKLNHLRKWTERRVEIANQYNQQIGDIPGLRVPALKSHRSHVYHLYVIRAKQRDALREYLKEHGVDTRVHYPIPIHMQSAFSDLGYREGDFPVTEMLTQEIVSLPMYPELTDDEVLQVTAAIRQFYGV